MKVVAISMALKYRKPKKLEDNLNYIENILKEVKNIKPDLVALPEVFAYSGVELKKRKIEEYEKIKTFLKGRARKTSCWICGSSYDVVGEKIYNRCFL